MRSVHRPGPNLFCIDTSRARHAGSLYSHDAQQLHFHSLSRSAGAVKEGLCGLGMYVSFHFAR